MPSPGAASTPESKTFPRKQSGGVAATNRKRPHHHSASIDELRVLSSEDVVDVGAVGVVNLNAHSSSFKVKNDSYYYGKPNNRDEYVPPRTLATRPDFEDETAVNKGCFYFMSCLDAFWIL